MCSGSASKCPSPSQMECKSTCALSSILDLLLSGCVGPLRFPATATAPLLLLVPAGGDLCCVSAKVCTALWRLTVHCRKLMLRSWIVVWLRWTVFYQQSIRIVLTVPQVGALSCVLTGDQFSDCHIVYRMFCLFSPLSTKLFHIGLADALKSAVTRIQPQSRHKGRPDGRVLIAILSPSCRVA